MANLWQPSLQTILDDNGNPVSGGKWHFYVSETTTLATVYAGEDGSTALTNPVVADATGRLVPVYLDKDTIYRARKTDASDVQIGVDVDPVRGFDESGAATDAAQVALDAAQVAADAAQVATDKATAEAAAGRAESASITGNTYENAAASNVPEHISGATITAAGSGGTNGDYDLVVSGGNLEANPTGTVTVSGGAVTAVSITGGGLYVGGSISLPTVDLSGITGLSGATVTLTSAVKEASGSEYWVVDASEDYVDLYQNLSGTSTLVSPSVKRPLESIITSTLDTETTGAATVANSGGNAASGFSLINQEGATLAGVVRTITVALTGNGAVTFFTASDDGSNMATRLQSIETYGLSGVNTYRVDLPIGVGEMVGVHGLGVKQTGTGKAAYFKSGLLAETSESVTANATYGLQMSAEIVTTDGETLNDMSDFGGEHRLGRATVPTTGGAVGGGFFITNYEPAAFDGFVTEVDFPVISKDPEATIAVVSLDSSGNVDLVRSRTVPVIAGMNKIRPQGLTISQGEFVGVLTSGQLRQTTTTGQPVFFTTGLPSTGTSKSILSNYGLALGVTVSRNEQAKITQSRAGIASGLTADGTTDVTDDIAAAQRNGAYVPEGDYAVTSLQYDGDGLYGDGRILLNGRQFFIPKAPMPVSLNRAFRSALARQIGDISGLAIMGDSLVQSSAGTSDWIYSMPYLMTGFANALTSPNDTPGVCQFELAGNELGITLPAGATYSGSGPQGQALVLADGDTLTLDSGDFRIVDVFYDQASGAGSLEFSFDGAAAYKTVDCSGTASTDETTYTGAETGQTTAGVYTITASGGPVTITGLIRLGELTNDFRGRLPIFNHGRNSQVITSLTADRIASMYKQCTVFGGDNPGAVLVYGENDQLSVLPDTIYTNFTAKIDELRAAGFKTIWGCGILRPGPDTYTYSTGCSYIGANGAVQAAFQDKGVPIIKLDAVEFYDKGHAPDGVHPNDPGSIPYTQLMIEGIAQSLS